MTTEKNREFNWEDHKHHVLISNGKEIFRAEIRTSLPDFISLKWGEHVAGTQFFRGEVDRSTNTFTSVFFPNEKKNASMEEISKWHLIDGKYEDYAQIGARVRVYFVLKTLDGEIESLPGEHRINPLIKLPQNSEVYFPCNFSFLID